MTIADNGIGLAPEFSLEKVKSLGMQLVQSMAYNQPDGTIDTKRKSRTLVNTLFSK